MLRKINDFTWLLDLTFTQEDLERSRIEPVWSEGYGLISTEHDSFLFDIRSGLGEGASGTVYKAWKFLTSESKQDPEKKVEVCAVKAIPLKNDIQLQSIKKESEIIKMISPEASSDPMVFGKQTFVVMPRAEGDPIISAEGVLNPTIKTFSWEQKIELIIKIFEALSKIHEKGIVHGDLKGQHILFQIVPATKTKPETISVSIVDFGSSHQLLKGKQSVTLKPGMDIGSPGHLIAESLTGQISQKTDIASIASDIMMILGATDPLKEKLNIRKKYKDPAKANQAELTVKYNMDGLENMLNNFQASSQSKMTITQLIHSYFKKMRDNNPNQRPAAESAAHFFKNFKSLLNEFHIANNQNSLFYKEESALSDLTKKHHLEFKSR